VPIVALEILAPELMVAQLVNVADAKRAAAAKVKKFFFIMVLKKIIVVRLN
jgi:hypothetical protein